MTDVRTMLRDLQDAEARHDEPRARLVRDALIELRLDLRDQGVLDGLTILDFALLGRLASQFEREGRPAEAMPVYAAAVAYARKQNDDYGAIFFSLRMACCAVASLDRQQSAVLLSVALFGRREALPGDPELPIAAASSISPLRTKESDIATLQANALYAVARHYAAWGDLGTAARALDRCLALLESHRDPYLRIGEVALFAFEVTADRGELERASLYRRHLTANDDASLQIRFDLAEAYVHRLRGELSRAEQAADSVYTRGMVVDPSAAAAAIRLRVDVLGLLNRLDEAGQLLDGFAQDAETANLRELVAARRSLEDETADTPRSAVGYRRPAANQAPAESADPHFATRRCERVREDWVRSSQQLLLTLHRGHATAAAAELAVLIRWSKNIDSPLIQAELENAWTKVALALGDVDSALTHAGAAAAQFQTLGMPLHEREAQLLAIAARQASGRGDTEETDRRFQRSAELIAFVESKLAPHDRRLFRLNKWNVLDLEMERWCSSLPQKEKSSHRELRRLLARIDARRQSAECSGDQSPWPLALPWALSLPRRTAVIYFLALPHRLEVFVLHRWRCHRFALPVPRAALWELVVTTIRSLRNAGTTEPPPACEATAAHLGLRQLLAVLPSTADELAIVPDDVLINMPFAALTIDSKTLPERGYTMTVVPSPRWDMRTRPALRRIAEGAAFGVGKTAVPGLDALESAEPEARVVAAALGSGVTAVIGTDAVAARVLNMLNRMQTVHFACHGEFDERNPTHSGLAVADRWLTIADIQQLDLGRLRLAVVGSCWSGTTKVFPGREMIGVPIKLLERGCSTVIASLWRLGDEAALDFAREYYTSVRRVPPARALADLQRRWTRARIPADWAWFAIYSSGITPAWPARAWLRLEAAARRAWTAFRTARGGASSASSGTARDSARASQ